jgi:hypothetical protein
MASSTTSIRLRSIFIGAQYRRKLLSAQSGAMIGMQRGVSPSLIVAREECIKRGIQLGRAQPAKQKPIDPLAAQMDDFSGVFEIPRRSRQKLQDDQILCGNDRNRMSLHLNSNASFEDAGGSAANSEDVDLAGRKCVAQVDAYDIGNRIIRISGPVFEFQALPGQGVRDALDIRHAAEEIDILGGPYFPSHGDGRAADHRIRNLLAIEKVVEPREYREEAHRRLRLSASRISASENPLAFIPAIDNSRASTLRAYAASMRSPESSGAIRGAASRIAVRQRDATRRSAIGVLGLIIPSRHYFT